MTFWLDAQLDPELASWIGSRFNVVVKHVVELGLERSSDTELYESARRFEQIVIVTKDGDFVGLSGRRGAPPQVLHMRCGNMRTARMCVFLSGALPDALARLELGESLVVVDGP